ncbi:radical SAM protein [Candidatus Magnetomonas plexicatena]|uniref:radical SAM protein n=1 Tax=Candidatus Magnetomonas plexicatena TaxID=2552947 RepID=UPI001C78C5CA|nr:radical SAM protein [Nitrospirales bacterium LBB_01]
MGMAGFAKSLLVGQVLKGAAITNAHIAITKRCNLGCPICYQKKKTDLLSLEDIHFLIDELKRLGAQRISLTGGEPLIRDDIGEILQHIKKAGMSSAMASNGLLAAKRAKELKDLDYISLSYKGTTCDLDEIKETFEVMRSIGIKYQICLVLVRDICVVEKIAKAIDYCQKRNILISIIPFYTSSWHIAPTRTTDASYENLPTDVLEHVPTTEAFEKVIRMIISRIDKGAPIAISKPSYQTCLNWPDLRKTALTKEEFAQTPVAAPSRCHAGRRFVMIDDDGTVLPCWTFRDMHGAAINYRTHGIREAIKRLDGHSCRVCLNLGFMELNYSFDLKPQTLWHYARISRRIS